MTVIYRQPQRLVVVRGTPLVRVLTCRATDGFDQALATADVTIPYPPPANVGHRALIRIYLGVDTPILRFTGYITSIRNTNWPTRILLGCEDVLSRTVRWKPETIVDLRNMTDEEAIQAILTTVGIPFVAANIQGTGKVLGTDAANQALLWQSNETALSKIQQIDQISVYTTAEGLKSVYRTFADRSGTVRRIPLNPLPSATAALSFVAGDDAYPLDIEQDAAGIEAAEPSDTATAAGFGGLSVTVTGTAPWAVISNPQAELYPMLETTTPSVDQHDLTSQAEYLQERKAANLLRGDFVTRRDDVIGPFATIHYDSQRTMQSLNALVQSKSIEQNERGGLTQQVSWISYRELNVFTDTNADGEPVGPYPEFDPSDGSELPVDGLPTFPDLPPEGDEDIIASFVVTMIDVESVLVDGAYVTLYTAAVESTSTSSTGTITALAWTAGGGGTPASGSGTVFNPSWTDLASATVTLQATDSNGNTATAPALPITLTMGAPVMRRELYTAEGDAGDFDGTTWRTDPNSNGTVGVVANGPLWAAGDTAQFGKLTAAVTDAPESEILSSYDIKSVWVERDVSTIEVAAGLTVGRVARSHDAGDNWTETTRLAEHTEDVLQVILSRYTPGQIWALQASAIWMSGDDGASWGLVRAAAGGQSFIALRLGPSRNLVSSTGGPSPLERAEAPGTPMTFTGTDPTEITGIAMNTYADEVCAITGDAPPKIWVTDAVGSWNMVPAEVPDLSAFSGAVPEPRNLQQDGSIARMVYAAVGDYALKSTDFFKTDSVHVLRHVGEGGCGAGPIVQIGQGDLVQAAAPTPAGSGGLYIGGNGVARYDVATDTWTDVTPPAVMDVVIGMAAYGDHVWVGSNIGEVFHSADRGATWGSDLGGPATGGFGALFTDGTNVVAIQANPNTTDFTAAVDSVLAYRPLDGSGSWTTIHTNAANILIRPGSVVGSRVWFAADDGSFNPLFKYLTIGGSTVDTNVTAAPASMATIKATSGDPTIAYGCQAYDSTPGTGKVWRFVNAVGTNVTPAGVPSDSSDGFVDVAPNADDSVVLAKHIDHATGGTIRRSTDHGATWSVVYGPNPSLDKGDQGNEIVWSPTTAGLVAVLTDANSVLYSTDSGATWTESSTTAPTNGRFAVAAL